MDLTGYDDQPNNGEGLSVQDIIDMLKKLPRKVRESNFPLITTEDCRIFEVTGIAMGQSDQAEKHEYHIHLKVKEQ